MHTIPATGDFHIPNLHVIGELEEHRIIGRVDEGDLAQCKAFAIHEGDRVRSAHFLFTGGVENFIPLNHPLAGNGYIFNLFTHDQCPVPLSPFCLRHERRHGWLFVTGEVCRAD